MEARRTADPQGRAAPGATVPARRPCPVCGAGSGVPVLSAPALPVFANVLRASRGQALAAERADLRLLLCPGCGHLHDDLFEPERVAYAEGYENSLHFSGVFRAYAEALAQRLVERYDLRGREVVEIGCGRGDFLRLLCERGGNRGTGFDPSQPGSPRVALPGGGSLEIVPRPFDESAAHLPADLVACRHVLEHLPDPLGTLRRVRATLGARRTVLFVEVPDGLWTLQRGGLWDVIYEHYGYFTPLSLRVLARAAGFRVLEESSEYGGQFLALEAVPDGGAATGAAGDAAPADGGSARGGGLLLPGERAELERLLAAAARFARTWDETLAHWRATLGAHAEAGREVALWGAGSKGTTFLNVLGDAGAAVRCVVDQNPAKHGRFVTGTGQPIVPPEALVARPPAVVVVMNPIYRDEIARSLEASGVRAEVVVA